MSLVRATKSLLCGSASPGNTLCPGHIITLHTARKHITNRMISPSSSTFPFLPSRGCTHPPFHTPCPPPLTFPPLPPFPLHPPPPPTKKQSHSFRKRDQLTIPALALPSTTIPLTSLVTGVVFGAALATILPSSSSCILASSFAAAIITTTGVVFGAALATILAPASSSSSVGRLIIVGHLCSSFFCVTVFSLSIRVCRRNRLTTGEGGKSVNGIWVVFGERKRFERERWEEDLFFGW